MVTAVVLLMAVAAVLVWVCGLLYYMRRDALKAAQDLAVDLDRALAARAGDGVRMLAYIKDHNRVCEDNVRLRADLAHRALVDSMHRPPPLHRAELSLRPGGGVQVSCLTANKHMTLHRRPDEDRAGLLRQFEHKACPHAHEIVREFKR